MRSEAAGGCFSYQNVAHRKEFAASATGVSEDCYVAKRQHAAKTPQGFLGSTSGKAWFLL
jgi:hypothetical protein